MAMRNRTDWGTALGDLRRSQDRGLRHVAEALGVSHQAVAGYEGGENPRIQTVERYLNVLGYRLVIERAAPDDPVATVIRDVPEVGA